MRIVLRALPVIACLVATPAHAGVFTDDLSRCIIEKTTDTDKTQLVRWMFAAVTKNPELAPMTNLTQAERDKINRAMADLYNRLILADCRSQAIAAIKNEGINSLFQSGQALGGAAANKLMNSPAGQEELGKWGDYMDKKGWEALAKEAGVSPHK